jgi:HlyD family secretion protein
MTANAEIVLEQRENVLRLPNTALRFRPADPELVAQGQALMSGGDRRARSGEAQAQTRGQGGGQRAAGQRGGGRGVAQIADTLQLNEQQRAAAQTAFENAVATMPRGQAGDRRAAMRRVREQVIAAIEPSLNAEQRELLAQLRSGAGPRAEARQQAIVWVLRNNRPAPVQVEIGVADNGYTLIHSGLSDGDEVIIGGGPQATNQQGSPFGGGGGRGGGGVRIRGA